MSCMATPKNNLASDLWTLGQPLIGGDHDSSVSGTLKGSAPLTLKPKKTSCRVAMENSLWSEREALVLSET